MRTSVMASMLAVGILSLGTVGFVSTASAQGKGAAATTTTAAAGGASGGKEEGYGYTFSDDPLSAGGFGPNDATIRVRPNAVRNTLIRPRTSFVPEMLKSVENL